MTTQLRLRPADHASRRAVAEGVSLPARSPERLLRKLRIVVADFAAATVGTIVGSSLWTGGENWRLNAHRPVLSVALFALPLALANAGLYRSGLIVRRSSEMRRLAGAMGVWFSGVVLAEYFRESENARGLLIAVAVATFLAVAVEREVVRQVFNRLRGSGRVMRHALVIGTEQSASELATSIAEDAPGYEVLGIVLAAPGPLPQTLAGIDVLGGVDDVYEIVKVTEVDTVVIASGGLNADLTTRLVRQITNVGVHVELSMALRGVADKRMSVGERGSYAVAHVTPPIRGGWRLYAKRVFDVTVAGSAIIAALPLCALLAVAVKLDSAGPVFFRQVRVGRGGREFSMLKFRTMVRNAEALKAELEQHNEADGPLFKIRDDPRITRIGRLLRKSSIDELPQLWNVVRGNMSLVGPRPALPSEVELWSPDLFHRLRVRPGLTGLWQISGRSDTTFESYERFDLYYTDNWSFTHDVWILIRTIPAVLSQRGAR